MAKENVSSLIRFAEELATEARKISVKYFRKNVGAKVKDDKSIVTKADVEIEKKLTSLIKKRFPEHSILGEELGSHNKAKEYLWVLDPIDGTLSFASGRPTFGVLIALLYKGKPIFGIIDQPINKERWLGDGKKSALNEKKIKTAAGYDLSKVTLASTCKDLFKGNDLKKFEKLQTKVRNTIYGGDCYLYGLLAIGSVDVVMESNLKVYDYAALVPVVEGAGGVITDWSGKKLDFKNPSNVIACSNKKIHAQVLKIIAG